jgi:cytochrome c556
MRFVLMLAAAGVMLAQAPSYQGVASSKQIMAAIQKPAMDSLVAMNKAGGPKDDKEWEVAGQNAAVLAETAQLLLMGDRPKDQDVWVKSSQRLLQAAAATAKAAAAKDLAGWQSAFNTVGGSCRSCHNVHRKKPGQQ